AFKSPRASRSRSRSADDRDRSAPVTRLPLQLSPSILASDFTRLGEEVAGAERGGADFIHVDVMDGHFVPNLSIGVPVVASLKRVARVPLDVHLMIENADHYVEAFV